MGVTGEAKGRAPAVRRALRMVDALAFERKARPADLARAVGIAKSSASDLIGTLLAERMLSRRGEDLVLGTLFIDVAAGFVGDLSTLHGFGIGWERSPVLHDYTVTLHSLIGSHSVCVGVRIGSQVLPYTPRAGSRLPLWPTEGPEPVLRAVPRADVRRALTEFPEKSSDDRAVRAWAQAPKEEALPGASSRDEAVPMLSATGNLELNALVSSGRDRGGPVVVTLHLAPSAVVDAARLQVALDAFAYELHPPTPLHAADR